MRHYPSAYKLVNSPETRSNRRVGLKTAWTGKLGTMTSHLKKEQVFCVCLSLWICLGEGVLNASQFCNELRVFFFHLLYQVLEQNQRERWKGKVVTGDVSLLWLDLFRIPHTLVSSSAPYFTNSYDMSFCLRVSFCSLSFVIPVANTRYQLGAGKDKLTAV